MALRARSQGEKADQISLGCAAHYTEDTRGPPGSCCLHSPIPRSCSGTNHRVNGSTGNNTHLEGSQAGKKHSACKKKKTHIPIPRAKLWLGCSTSPSSCYPVSRSQVCSTHSHALAPLMHMVPPGENTRTAKLGSYRLERATDISASSTRLGSPGLDIWQLCRHQETSRDAPRHRKQSSQDREGKG